MDKLAAALGIDPVELRLRNALKTGRRAHHRPGADGDGAGRRGHPDVRRRTAAGRGPGHARPSSHSRAAPDARPTGSRVRRGWVSRSGSRTSCTPLASTTTRRRGAGSRTASPPSPAPRSRSGRASSPSRSRSPAMCSESTRSCSAPPATTGIGSAGSTSASRQTWMSGGAVDAACRAVRERLLASVAARLRASQSRPSSSPDGRVVSLDRCGRPLHRRGRRRARSSRRRSIFRHAPTAELDAERPGRRPRLVRLRRPPGRRRRRPRPRPRAVVEIATSQDVGRVLNPVQLVGQLEGGIAQGVGLAVMEEIVLDKGRVRNPSVHRLHHPDGPRHARRARSRPSSRSRSRARPMGAKGAGEPPIDLLDGRRRGGDPQTPPAWSCREPRSARRTSPCSPRRRIFTDNRRLRRHEHRRPSP